MTITITTDGGFTGRGIGRVSVEDDVDAHVRDAAANARPESWAREYPARGADLVTYTLTFGGRTASWQNGAAIPGDLEALFAAAWAHK